MPPQSPNTPPTPDLRPWHWPLITALVALLFLAVLATVAPNGRLSPELAAAVAR